jgi:hypothetical protein
VLFWAAVIVESYTSYGLSRADPFADRMQEHTYPFNVAACCDQLRRATDTIREF